MGVKTMSKSNNDVSSSYRRDQPAGLARTDQLVKEQREEALEGAGGLDEAVARGGDDLLVGVPVRENGAEARPCRLQQHITDQDHRAARGGWVGGGGMGGRTSECECDQYL